MLTLTCDNSDQPTICADTEVYSVNSSCDMLTIILPILVCSICNNLCNATTSNKTQSYPQHITIINTLYVNWLLNIINTNYVNWLLNIPPDLLSDVYL